jgi:hypothetical protein
MSGGVQVTVIANAGECVEYDPCEGVGAAVCLGYHAQGAATVAVQQAVAKLLQQRAPDLHVREVIVAAGAQGRGGAPLLRWRRQEVRPQQGAQPLWHQGG